MHRYITACNSAKKKKNKEQNHTDRQFGTQP